MPYLMVFQDHSNPKKIWWTAEIYEHLPRKGETIRWSGLEFEVMDVIHDFVSRDDALVMGIPQTKRTTVTVVMRQVARPTRRWPR